MKRSKFSEHQIVAILKAVEAGRTVRDVCREHEISDEVREQTEKWLKEYNEERPHESLGHLTPREYLLTQKPEISSNSWV